MPQLTTSATRMAGGRDAVAGVGQADVLTVSGTFSTDDLFTLVFTNNLTAISDRVGSGVVTGLSPSFLFTYSDKLYALIDTNMHFSGLGDAVAWNNVDGVGNGFIAMANHLGTAEDLQAIATYQGGLAIMSRRTTQIWNVDPDPALYSKRQVLQNVGTVAPLSVHSVGDLDIYALADNGFRSIRVRDSSNNAVVNDVGSPIDEIIQPLLAGLTDAEKSQACGIVEPSSNRYWCFIPKAGGGEGTIYVFSFFPTGEVAAWSTYMPTIETLLSPNEANYELDGEAYFTGLEVGETYYWEPNGSEVLKTGAIPTTVPAGIFTASITTAFIQGGIEGEPVLGSLWKREVVTPEKFIVYNGQVWFRAGDVLYRYGGSDGVTYDDCRVVADLPWLDAKRPATQKHWSAIDAGMEGKWRVRIGSDLSSPSTLKLVHRNENRTYQRGDILMGRSSTHIKARMTTYGGGYRRFSNLIFHYDMEDSG